MTEATNTPNTGRRALLAGGVAIPSVALGGALPAANPDAALAAPLITAGPAAASNPDAELIRLCEAFVAEEDARDAATDYLNDKPMNEWSKEDEAVWDANCAWNTRYHERVAEISEGVPTTTAGLAAQAAVLLRHFRSGDDDALNLAKSVLRVLGRPLPVWAT